MGRTINIRALVCVAVATVTSSTVTFSSVAGAQEGNRKGALFSTQIQFDDKKVPVITIGIMDRQESIVFAATGGLDVMPDGPGGSLVSTASGGTWTATLVGATPAKVGWRVELERLPAGDLVASQTARKAWAARGIKAHHLEVGSVFGFFGKVLDTREVVISSHATWPTREEAEAEATRVAAKYERETRVLPALLERPRGTIVLTNGTTTIRSQDAMWIRPKKADAGLQVKSVEFGRGFNWHGREDRRFRGLLYLAVDPTAKLAVANMLPAEDLLRGIVPSEIYPSAPAAALEAQAISARGELLVKIGHRHFADPFLICSDVHCQAYKGLDKEDDRTDRAISKTRGKMLFDHDHLVDTVYSANCGGSTEHNDLVWGGGPKATLRGHADGAAVMGEPTEENVHKWVHSRPESWCSKTRFGSKNYRWEKRVAVDTIRKGLGAQGKDPGVPREISVLKRGVSGRAIQVSVKGTRKTVTVDGELNIRRAFGGLKSAMFVLTTMAGRDGHPVNFTFTGGGFGHGVGLCQTGASGMAEAGKSFADILSHYYTGSVVERIY